MTKALDQDIEDLQANLTKIAAKENLSIGILKSETLHHALMAERAFQSTCSDVSKLCHLEIPMSETASTLLHWAKKTVQKLQDLKNVHMDILKGRTLSDCSKNILSTTTEIDITEESITYGLKSVTDQIRNASSIRNSLKKELARERDQYTVAAVAFENMVASQSLLKILEDDKNCFLVLEAVTSLKYLFVAHPPASYVKLNGSMNAVSLSLSSAQTNEFDFSEIDTDQATRLGRNRKVAFARAEDTHTLAATLPQHKTPVPSKEASDAPTASLPGLPKKKPKSTIANSRSLDLRKSNTEVPAADQITQTSVPQAHKPASKKKVAKTPSEQVPTIQRPVVGPQKTAVENPPTHMAYELSYNVSSQNSADSFEYLSREFYKFRSDSLDGKFDVVTTPPLVPSKTPKSQHGGENSEKKSDDSSQLPARRAKSQKNSKRRRKSGDRAR